MIKILAPIIHRDAYTHAIEDELLGWMNEAIFAPLLLDLREYNVPVSRHFQAIKFDEFGAGTPTRTNAAPISAVEDALTSGRIHYADGVFSGRFGAKISRELREIGATFDSRDNTFRISVDKLPLNMRGAIVASAAQSKALHEQIIATLNVMQENAAIAPANLNFNKALEFITNDLGKQYEKTTSAIESISVQAQFTPAMRKKMDEALTNNLELSIKNFAQERIPELRRRVEENVLAGMRTDRLAKIIEAEFGVDKRKAAFLADQEAGLVTAKYREIRYATLGTQDYIWQDSGDNRVRHSHRVLNGRRFSFKSPPIVDPATGRRANPGEDYRCRCSARPIVVFGDVETGADLAA